MKLWSHPRKQQPEYVGVPSVTVDHSECHERLQRESRLTLLVTCVALVISLVFLGYIALVFFSHEGILERGEGEESFWRERTAPRRRHEQYNNFIAFTKKYNKTYGDAELMLKAYVNYEKTMQRAEKYSKEDGGVEHGENEMADMSDEQFEKMLLPKDFYSRRREEATFIKRSPPPMGEKAVSLPPSFDWRTKGVITPVKAQGSCGSCWAFAATATVEAAWMIKYNESRILSEQTLLDCDLANNACDGGDEDKAFRFIHRDGLAYLADYPYVAHRQNTCMAGGVENRTHIQTAYFLHQDEKSMRDWLINFGPVNIGMSVIQPMRTYKDGVFHPSEYACKNEVIGLHAMLIVGYGTSDKGEDYWIIKNSWGSSFGKEGGYIYFARGFNACFVEDEPVGILA